MNNSKKKIRKKVRFDFYREEKEKYSNLDNIWSFEEIFNYYIKNNNLKTNLNIENEEIEIEPNSILKDENLYFFLVSNLRNDAIPAKKKIGQEKIEIELDDDEYIGEFTGVVYDSKTKVFMIQVNKFGLNPVKIEKYLKALKNHYISINNKEDIVNIDFSLNIIVNPKELETVADSKEIRSIHLKSSSTSLAKLKGEANKNEKNSVTEIKKIVETFGNVNFEITISANFKEETSLEKEASKNIINSVKEFFKKNNSGISFSVTRRKDDDSNVDTVDFLLPKLFKYITLLIEPKKSIGRDFLRVEMFKCYKQTKNEIERIIYGV